MHNLDEHTVEGFGNEWGTYQQDQLSEEEIQSLFDSYFHIFPWDKLPENAEGFDLGCGSGRWAKLVAPKVHKLNCIDASSEALSVAQKNLSQFSNCDFFNSSVDAMPLEDVSMDFGYSLGVLHHIPDTLAGIKHCTKKLKPGAPFLIYLYYALDNKPLWYRTLWQASDQVRKKISEMPFQSRLRVSQMIAGSVYYPLSKTAWALEKAGLDVSNFPLSFYRNTSFYTMKTDALDRFGTKLEQRFTRDQIHSMLKKADLENIQFSETTPFWCAVGYKK